MITALLTLAPMVFKLVQKNLEIKEKEVELGTLNTDTGRVKVMHARRVYVLDTKTGKEKVAYLCE